MNNTLNTNEEKDFMALVTESSDGKSVFRLDCIDVFVENNEDVLYAELFGKTQIIKAVTNRVLNKSFTSVLSDKRLSVGYSNAKHINFRSKMHYKREIAPLERGYSLVIIYTEELLSKKYLITKKPLFDFIEVNEETLKDFSNWLDKLGIPVPKDKNFRKKVFELVKSKSLTPIISCTALHSLGDKAKDTKLLTLFDMSFLIDNEYKEICKIIELVYHSMIRKKEIKAKSYKSDLEVA